ncbi:TPA: conjugal transfer protein [Escherichia coli]|nr:conjugal transfer protein [Escherichia coli]HAW5096667.1 conjugal transfer protein [Escherichia coli]HBN1734811.1 conjugal transfer protein [Escherichia coli]
MRKAKAIFTAIVFSLGAGSIPAYASDPCASVLCLYGKAVGQGGGSECRSAEKDFFNILKKKKGSIRWSKTFDARKSFLNQCSTADPAAISKIMSKFGRVKG